MTHSRMRHTVSSRFFAFLSSNNITQCAEDRSPSFSSFPTLSVMSSEAASTIGSKRQRIMIIVEDDHLVDQYDRNSGLNLLRQIVRQSDDQVCPNRFWWSMWERRVQFRVRCQHPKKEWGVKMVLWSVSCVDRQHMDSILEPLPVKAARRSSVATREKIW